MLPSQLLLFTALDGTLLQHSSSDWAPAQEALAEVERRRVPLVLVTDRTRAEVEVFRRKIGHAHPFITEHGGGIFIPQGYFNLHIQGSSRVGRYQCVAFGRPYAELTAALERIASEAHATVVGFHQLSTRELAQNTGLNLRHADLARLREFDEPFFFAGETAGAPERFIAVARQCGFQAVHRDRFWHLAAGCSVSRAVGLLTKLYRLALRGRLRIVGIGSAASDLPLLTAVDHPVLLPQAGGGFPRRVLEKLPAVERGPASGPVGWNQVVLRILRGTRDVSSL